MFILPFFKERLNLSVVCFQICLLASMYPIFLSRINKGQNPRAVNFRPRKGCRSPNLTLHKRITFVTLLDICIEMYGWRVALRGDILLLNDTSEEIRAQLRTLWQKKQSQNRNRNLQSNILSSQNIN